MSSERGADVLSQQARKPPSTGRETPLVMLLLSLSRNRILFTTSSTSDHRGHMEEKEKTFRFHSVFMKLQFKCPHAQTHALMERCQSEGVAMVMCSGAVYILGPCRDTSPYRLSCPHV